MSKTKEKIVRPTVDAISAALRSAVVEDGELLVVPAEKYYEHAGAEGLGEEVVDHVSDFNGRYAAASVRAVGEAALDLMMADSSIDTVAGGATMGGRELTLKVERQKVVPVPGGEAVTVYGASSIKIEESGGPALKKARAHLKDVAKGLWGGKD